MDTVFTLADHFRLRVLVAIGVLSLIKKTISAPQPNPDSTRHGLCSGIIATWSSAMAAGPRDNMCKA